ncbi:MAG TPA: ABC transporter ATP-binding protein [Planctomycetota bacterium]|nr:ABC transporter ATP-binding protein [Planctomycetota bacterium]
MADHRSTREALQSAGIERRLEEALTLEAHELAGVPEVKVEHSVRRGEADVLIELAGVTQRYAGEGGRQGRVALEAVNLRIFKGEFVCLVGPSGCGKSTILNLIAGFMQPSEGRVLYKGRPIAGPGPDRAVMFQDHALFPWLTVQRNVEFGLKMANRHERQIRKKVARNYLAMVNMAGHEREYPHQLSGGMRQRVALARSLALESDVLLMDEPFSALDPTTRDMLHEQLQRIWMETKKTIVFVTHSLKEAIRLADRIVLMGTNPGRVRREIAVDIARPRELNSLALDEINIVLRRELQNEHRPQLPLEMPGLEFNI